MPEEILCINQNHRFCMEKCVYADPEVRADIARRTVKQVYEDTGWILPVNSYIVTKRLLKECPRDLYASKLLQFDIE